MLRWAYAQFFAKNLVKIHKKFSGHVCPREGAGTGEPHPRLQMGPAAAKAKAPRAIRSRATQACATKSQATGQATRRGSDHESVIESWKKGLDGAAMRAYVWLTVRSRIGRRSRGQQELNMAQVMIAKTHVVEVDVDAFTPAVREYIWNYGLKQVLNDAGSAGKSPDEKLGMAQKKLDALLRGEVGRAREAVDEVEAEARKIARKMIGDALRRKGKKVADFDEEMLKEKVKELAARDDVRTAAMERLAIKADVAGDDVLDGLL